MSERFAHKWDHYAAHLPPGAGEVQKRETRRAFYAGGWALFDVIMRGLDPEAEPTDADFDRLTELRRELERFAADVEAGRA